MDSAYTSCFSTAARSEVCSSLRFGCARCSTDCHRPGGRRPHSMAPRLADGGRFGDRFRRRGDPERRARTGTRSASDPRLRCRRQHGRDPTRHHCDRYQQFRSRRRQPNKALNLTKPLSSVRGSATIERRLTAVAGQRQVGPTRMPFTSQDAFEVRCEWGPQAVAALEGCRTFIVVDVLSFSTCVAVAAARGVEVIPCRFSDREATELADRLQAIWQDEGAVGYPYHLRRW